MPAVVRVRSEDNAFQHAEVLKRNRTRRHQSREFFVEGVKPLNRLLQHGWAVTSFWYSAEQRLSAWAQQILAASPAARRYELPAPLMAKLSDREEPSELVALAVMPPDDPGRVRFGPTSVAVVFDRPSSPGNLGTLIRSADALGAVGLLFSGHAVDLYDPQTIRASMGSIFAIPVVRVEGTQDVAAWIASQPVRPAVVGTDSDAETALDEIDLAGPIVLIAGNEARGMSYRYRDLCDVVARIPMSGSADSINVACATSIALYEAGRQHRRLPE
jgi:23S rRNA (uridine2479-2'-O)-methyltransferase